ncbi:MAG: hypothetical protein ACOYMV_12835 [Verrucomicrobiia bacterium]
MARRKRDSRVVVLIAAIFLPVSLWSCKASVNPESTYVAGIVSVGRARPVVGAVVTVMSADGSPVPGATAMSGALGSFGFFVERDTVGAKYRVVATGGRATGQDLRGALWADVQKDESGSGPTYVTTVTTLAAEWLARHPAEGLKASLSRAKEALAIPEWVDPELAAMRSEQYVSADALLEDAASLGGFTAWAAYVIDRLENGTTTPYPGIDAPGNGWGTGIAITWSVVAGAASSCSPSDSPIPGLGSLGAMVSDAGLVGRNPACDYAGLSSQIADVARKLDELSGQLSTVASKVDEVLNAAKDAKFTTLKTTFDLYATAVTTTQDLKHLLAATIAEKLSDCSGCTGCPATATLVDLANAGLTPSKDFTCSDGVTAFTKWGSIQAASKAVLDSMPSFGHWAEAPEAFKNLLTSSNGDYSHTLPYALWELKRGQFVSRGQIEEYVDFVDNVAGLVNMRALQLVEKARYSPARNPDQSVNDVETGKNIMLALKSYPVTEADFEKLKPSARMPEQLSYLASASLPALSTSAPKGPILDLVNNKMWIAACLDGWNPGDPYGKGTPPVSGSADSCPTRGILQYYDVEHHWYLNRPPLPCCGWPSTSQFPDWDSASWTRQKGAPASASVGFRRPTEGDLALLEGRALGAGMGGSAVNSWLQFNGSGVFDGLTTTRWVATSNYNDTCARDMHCASGSCWNVLVCNKSLNQAPRAFVMLFRDIGNLRDRNLDRYTGPSIWANEDGRVITTDYSNWHGAGPNSTMMPHASSPVTEQTSRAWVDGGSWTGTPADWAPGKYCDGLKLQYCWLPPTGAWHPDDPQRSVALLVGDVPDMKNYVPFYGR